MKQVDTMIATGTEGFDPADLMELEATFSEITEELGSTALLLENGPPAKLTSDVIKMEGYTDDCTYSTWKSCNPC